jgi:hypothetical protein
VSKLYIEKLRARVMLAWHCFKKPPSVDTIVNERLNEIPAKHVSRIKRRLARKRAMHGK